LPKLATPRYLPNRPFPAYRHLPGQTPHPIKHPQGHSHHLHSRHLEIDYTGPPLTTQNWRQHDAYLWGIDLYNHAYWWEAHEAWEGPWRLAAGIDALFLQGLIQTSAALVKWRQQKLSGQEKLYRKGQDKLQSVLAQTDTPIYMGLDLEIFLGRLARFLTLSSRTVDFESNIGLIGLELARQ
jgi:hypothetical protein